MYMCWGLARILPLGGGGGGGGSDCFYGEKFTSSRQTWTYQWVVYGGKTERGRGSPQLSYRCPDPNAVGVFQFYLYSRKKKKKFRSKRRKLKCKIYYNVRSCGQTAPGCFSSHDRLIVVCMDVWMLQKKSCLQLLTNLSPTNMLLSSIFQLHSFSYTFVWFSK